MLQYRSLTGLETWTRIRDNNGQHGRHGRFARRLSKKKSYHPKITSRFSSFQLHGSVMSAGSVVGIYQCSSTGALRVWKPGHEEWTTTDSTDHTDVLPVSSKKKSYHPKITLPFSSFQLHGSVMSAGSVVGIYQCYSTGALRVWKPGHEEWTTTDSTDHADAFPGGHSRERVSIPDYLTLLFPPPAWVRDVRVVRGRKKKPLPLLCFMGTDLFR